MDIILAIDPGNEKSAYVKYTPGKYLACEYLKNHELREFLKRTYADILILEMIASYGMPVGKSVFDTCVWVGRFIEAWNKAYRLMYRSEVKMHLCNSMRAKDSNIRQALIDKFPPIGGGKTPQIGTKNKPGLLYGIKGDMWSALAVAVTYCEQNMS